MDFATIVQWVKDITAILTFLAVFIKPLREKLFGLRARRLGDQATLRHLITEMYYSGLPEKALHRYEWEDLQHMAKAYFANGGNSYVKKIAEEMDTWEIID